MQYSHVFVGVFALTLTFDNGKSCTFVYSVKFLIIGHEVAYLSDSGCKTKMPETFYLVYKS